MFQEFSKLPGSSKFVSVSISKVLSHILIFFLHVRSCFFLLTRNERARTEGKKKNTKETAVPSLSQKFIFSLSVASPDKTEQGYAIHNREKKMEGYGGEIFFPISLTLCLCCLGELFSFENICLVKNIECANVQSEWQWSFHHLYNT